MVDLMASRLVPSTVPMLGIDDSAPTPGPSVSRFSNNAPPAGFWGGTYTASDGELVTVHVSNAYAQDPAGPQSVAEFFARGIVHGPELANLAVVVVEPLPNVQSNCGSPGVLACYIPSYSVIFMPGDAVPGISLASLVAHEYGHHLATYRVNPPWLAVTWGTKRWASYTNICQRAVEGAVFPGDEGAHYTLNPGEGFAETYRVLNEQAWGWTSFTWPIVDQSFFPDQGAIDALGQDIVTPWVANHAISRVGRFTARGSRVRTWRLATPLDGTYVGSVKPRAAYSLVLRDPGTGEAVAAGTGATVTNCGGRDLQIDVVRRARGAGSYTLNLSAP